MFPFPNKRAIVADTASTDLSHENIDGIVLGTNIKESSFLKEHDFTKDDSNSYTLDDDKYGILTSYEEEVTLISGDNTSKTGKGVKLGDSINEVIQKYGENYYEYTMQGVQTIGYIDHGNRCKIDFWYVDRKVITIILSNKDVDPYL